MNNISGASHIEEILSNLGYILSPDVNGWRARPIYRDSSNDTSLKVFSENGNFVDFSAGIKGSFEELIRLTQNLDSIDKAREWLKDKDYQFSSIKPEVSEPLIKQQYKIFPKEELSLLEEKHDYLIGRGISLDTAKQFKAGLFSGQHNRLKDRYVWVIFNSKNEIVGYSGRDLTNKKKIKVKHLGNVKEWCWPCYINIKDIQKKSEVIVVESATDVESLFEAGIKNCVCSFGLNLSFAYVNLFLRLNLNKIILATNNEPDNNNRGLEGAKKMESRLLKYFDRKSVQIYLPKLKDFNFMLTTSGKQSIIDWYENRT